jgi:endoglycosylceramidase
LQESAERPPDIPQFPEARIVLGRAKSEGPRPQQRRGAQALSALLGIAFLLVGVVALLPSVAVAGPTSTPDVHRVGHWLVDQDGRVVVLHGFNVERKLPPYVPTEFGAADARLLAQNGFTVVRLAVMWAGVEPQPGHYDEAYLQSVLRIDTLLSHFGIHTVLDMHQDLWSHTAQPTLGDGAPAWATLGTNVDQDFAAFWDNQKGPGGVGIQTRFLDMWHHLALALRRHPNVIGIDPFNEPYPGSNYPSPCSPYARCPAFEEGALTTFYRRVTAAIRSAGAAQVILPEGVADSTAPPVLPKLSDPQSAFNFHMYCRTTQLSTSQVPVGARSASATACAPVNDQHFASFTGYAQKLGEPAILTEFSCNDVNPDNADVVDGAGATFTSWIAWAYYPKEIGSDCPDQGLLSVDGDPGSVKVQKLQAFSIPYATSIAGTPLSTSLDRSTRTFKLSFKSAPVPGARLTPRAQTVIFVPTWMYPAGYSVRLRNARMDSSPSARWLRVVAKPDRIVHVSVSPR